MEACPPSRCGQAQLLPSVARRGSGDKQALAKLGRVEIDEVAVAFGPPAGGKVITEAAHCPLLGVPPDSGPDRHAAADYPLLSRLRRDRLVETSWQESEAGPPRRYYHLTDAGRRALADFSDEWTTFRDSVDALLQHKAIGHEREH